MLQYHMIGLGNKRWIKTKVEIEAGHFLFFFLFVLFLFLSIRCTCRVLEYRWPHWTCRYSYSSYSYHTNKQTSQTMSAHSRNSIFIFSLLSSKPHHIFSLSFVSLTPSLSVSLSSIAVAKYSAWTFPIRCRDFVVLCLWHFDDKFRMWNQIFRFSGKITWNDRKQYLYTFGTLWVCLYTFEYIFWIVKHSIQYKLNGTVRWTDCVRAGGRLCVYVAHLKIYWYRVWHRNSFSHSHMHKYIKHTHGEGHLRTHSLTHEYLPFGADYKIVWKRFSWVCHWSHLYTSLPVQSSLYIALVYVDKC